MTIAKLPPEFIKQPLRSLADLQVGKKSAIHFRAMEVDAENRCYLNPYAELREAKNRISVVAHRSRFRSLNPERLAIRMDSRRVHSRPEDISHLVPGGEADSHRSEKAINRAKEAA
jgi:hypothetical protein